MMCLINPQYWHDIDTVLELDNMVPNNWGLSVFGLQYLKLNT